MHCFEQLKKRMDAVQESRRITLEGVKFAIVRIAKAKEEDKVGLELDLCRHVVKLYKGGDHFGNKWGYEQLQDAASGLEEQLGGEFPKAFVEEFAERIMFLLKSLCVIGQGIRGTENLLAINVRGDGSCFYQALFYGMLWACPDEVENIRSVHAFKVLIMERLFGRTTLNTDAARLREKERPETTPDKGKRREYRRRLLLFESLKGDFGGKVDSVNEQFSNSAWFKTDNTSCVDDAFDIQVLIFTRTTGNNASLLRSPGSDAQVEFTGQPVVLLLLSGNHFYILSRQPFVAMGLLRGDGDDPLNTGRGKRGLVVPASIKFEFMERGKIMPFLQMCMRCKKRLVL